MGLSENTAQKKQSNIIFSIQMARTGLNPLFSDPISCIVSVSPHCTPLINITNMLSPILPLYANFIYQLPSGNQTLNGTIIELSGRFFSEPCFIAKGYLFEYQEWIYTSHINIFPAIFHDGEIICQFGYSQPYMIMIFDQIYIYFYKMLI